MKTLFVLFAVLLPRISHAEWQSNGTPLATAASRQVLPQIVSDGAGGAIVTWHDFRNESDPGDIYAQRVSASGVVLWTDDGVALCTAAVDQVLPTIASDGAYGAIVTWQDRRSATQYNIYAQRVNASGVVQWLANGVALSTAPNDQVNPMSIADGAGGAIAMWEDYRNGPNSDIYAQRMNASGVTQWIVNGEGVCVAANDQLSPAIVSDGAEGAIMMWEDYRNGPNSDIYAQRLNASGAWKWIPQGVAVCTAEYDQLAPTIAPDGAGGAIATWYDARSFFDWDIAAQRMNEFGVEQWSPNGVPICIDFENQFFPTIVADGAGGAIMAWIDYRSGVHADIYAQRVNASGVAQWMADGVALCTAVNDQLYPKVVSDGAEGAIVIWDDYRFGTDYDVYAQRVNASGLVLWTAGGVALCTLSGHQSNATITSDAAGGAIATWNDSRGGPNSADIYAQRLSSNGQIPTGVRDTPSASVVVLTPNYPNPFSDETTFDLDLRSDTIVDVQVFDVAGRSVRHIEMGRVHGGRTRLAFDGLDDSGQLLASGVYFYRVTSAGATVTRKMVITR